MKIEINSPDFPNTRGYTILANGKLLRNRNSYMFHFAFNDAEIEYILGEEYQKFENGKYEFNVPKWKLDTIEDNYVSKNRSQLIWAYNYTNI